MTTPVVRNVIWYLAIALAGAVLATGLQLGVVLAGDDPILMRPLAATFVQTLFAALATAAGTAFRPKAGREDISELVSEVGHSAARGALEDEAVKQSAGSEAPRIPTVSEIADELERRRRERADPLPPGKD